MLGLLETLVSSYEHRRFILVYCANSLWTFRVWHHSTDVSATLNWYGPGFWDCLTRDLLFYDYAPREGDVIVDVGAGMGESVAELSRVVGPGGRVVAIEAHPTSHAGLLRSMRLNRLQNCEDVWVALSDVSGTLELTDGPDLDTNSVLSAEGPMLVVPALRFDELAKRLGLGHIDLLKMNIEGAEVLALEGMTELMPFIAHIVISCHDFLAESTGDERFRTKSEVTRFLESAGYVVRTREDPRPFAADYVYASR